LNVRSPLQRVLGCYSFEKFSIFGVEFRVSRVFEVQFRISRVSRIELRFSRAFRMERKVSWVEFNVCRVRIYPRSFRYMKMLSHRHGELAPFFQRGRKIVMVQISGEPRDEI